MQDFNVGDSASALEFFPSIYRNIAGERVQAVAWRNKTEKDSHTLTIQIWIAQINFHEHYISEQVVRASNSLLNRDFKRSFKLYDSAQSPFPAERNRDNDVEVN